MVVNLSIFLIYAFFQVNIAAHCEVSTSAHRILKAWWVNYAVMRCGVMNLGILYGFELWVVSEGIGLHLEWEIELVTCIQISVWIPFLSKWVRFLHVFMLCHGFLVVVDERSVVMLFRLILCREFTHAGACEVVRNGRRPRWIQILGHLMVWCRKRRFVHWIIHLKVWLIK